MNDKIVTHEDLRHVATVERIMRRNAGEGVSPGDYPEVVKFVERLRAAAEADQPPLPEGWVLLTVAPHVQQVVWHKAGTLYCWSDCSSTVDDVEQLRASLSPLRPTITEADIERAARAARAAHVNGADNWDGVSRGIRDGWMKTTRAALEALGIEVTP